MVMERKGPSTFSYGVERISKTELRVHRSLEATVYAILLGIFSSDIVKQKHYYFMFQFSMNFFRGIVADIFPLSCPLCLICWHCFCEGRSPYVEVCKMTFSGSRRNCRKWTCLETYAEKKDDVLVEDFHLTDGRIGHNEFTSESHLDMRDNSLEYEVLLRLYIYRVSTIYGVNVL